MKQIANVLFSAGLMAVIMAVFAISIAAATFIENDFGTASARAMVYNARWFEMLLFLGVINLLGNIFIKKLYTRSKFPLFVFHVAFVIILAGSAITRYTGYEGTISIREGESSRMLVTNQTHIQIFPDLSDLPAGDFPVSFINLGRNKFNKTFRYNNQSYRLSCRSFVSNAVPMLEPSENGQPMAEIVYADSEGRKSLIIASGETISIGALRLVMNAPAVDSQTIMLITRGDSLEFIAPYPVSLANMADQSFAILEKQQRHTFNPMQLYTFNNNMIVLNRFVASGKRFPKSLPEMKGNTYDALIMEVASDEDKKEFVLWGKAGYPGAPEKVELSGVNFLFTYGSASKELPFELKLDDFIIERYPGSQSPSSFESKVTLADTQKGHRATYRIFMNNILKYRGYRFFQSSYDPDEKGTILAVNHDRAGTLFTYFGYLLMGLGMFLSLFSKGSHFKALSSEITALNKRGKGAVLILAFLMLSGISYGQESILNTLTPVNASHAAIFGRMLIQDNSGRIEPINTLSAEVLRKLCRKSRYKDMNPDQVFLGMMVNPGLWQLEPIIKVNHPDILKIMGSGEKYYSFANFFKDEQYILQPLVEDAYNKNASLRSKFDNEMIRLDERINICYYVFSGEFLRLFAVSGDISQSWYNHQDIRGKINNEDSVFVENILYLYLQEVRKSQSSGDWKIPDDIINSISLYQQRYAADILPSPRRVSMEIFMNKSDVFARISNYYGLVGFVLLILQFAVLFFKKLKLKIPVNISILLIIILFSLHTVGLGVRWYVAGHAPWSNGYEALTYIAWATVLAGLIFATRSAVTLSVTAILAFLILHTAHLSWMDPQITNLVPVLKSYWLVIHVAIITASYGFLGMGALLAYVNLLLMVFLTQRNQETIHLTILKQTNIIGMSLIIGLYLLAVGSFLGGVWANESWGRYWGWDPKETWAMVTILVYAFITHMRMVPGLKSVYAFNLSALLGFSTALMTYFGVNYYLTGLHSYAKGDPLPVPPVVYYTLVVVFVTAVAAYINDRRIRLPKAVQ